MTNNSTNLRNNTLTEYLEAVAARQSTPGGGAVAAVVAAEACGLIAMVANFSKSEESRDIARRSQSSITRLLQLANEDSLAFQQVMQAYREDGDLQVALEAAAGVPTQVIFVCSGHIEDLAHLADRGNSNLLSDVGIAASLLQSSIGSSELNILVNMKNLDDALCGDLKATIALIPDLNARLQKLTRQVRSGLS